jgi:hypothetical protein
MFRLIMAWEADPQNREKYNLSELTGLTGAWEIAFPEGTTPTYEVLSHMRTWFLANPLRLMRILSDGLADEIRQVVVVDEALEGKRLPCPKWEALQVSEWFPNLLQKAEILPRTSEESEALQSLLKKLKAAKIPC